MAESTSKKPLLDLSQNKANIMLEKAAKGRYGIAGVCCVGLTLPFHGCHGVVDTYPTHPNLDGAC